EQHVHGPQLHVLDDPRDSRPLGLPADRGEHELLPEALTFEARTRLIRVVLRADRVDDSPTIERAHDLRPLLVELDLLLAEHAPPDHLIEVPDHELKCTVELRGARTP